MDAKQHLYSALGQVAYSIAMADGKAQKEEKNTFLDTITEAAKKYDADYDFAGIVFQVIERDHIDMEVSYQWALDQVKLGSNRLTNEIKEKMIGILTEVAKAYPPVTVDETAVLEKFKKDLDRLQDKLTY